MRRAFILLLLALAGCVTRPDAMPIGDAGLAVSAIVAPRDDDGDLAGALPQLRGVGRRHDVLVLSGGGSDGAFGAGVLVGWSEAGTRPEFDVVTGVSTGALVAVLAFAGPAHDGTLRRAFTGVTRSQVYRKRGLVGLLRRGAIYDRRPLERMIAGIVDAPLLAQIAAAHARGRRLYVATTNLDDGTPTMWDMGAIAASPSPAAGELFRRVLLASSAVPGAFPPVYIQERAPLPTMHVDGGVKTALLLRGFMLDAAGGDQAVWAIVNGHVGWRGAEAASGAGARSIVGRAVAELLRSVTAGSLYNAYVITRRTRAAFNLAYLPDDVAELNPIEFDPVAMQALFDRGAAIGRGGQWAKAPPRLGRYEVVP